MNYCKNFEIGDLIYDKNREQNGEIVSFNDGYTYAYICDGLVFTAPCNDLVYLPKN